MAMLKTVTSGSGSTGQLADYLAFGRKGTPEHEQRLQRYLAGENSSRALVFGHSPNLPDGQLEWHEAMDATRKKWGKDKPPAYFIAKMRKDPSLRWRSYYHWVLSPAAEDRAGAAEVAEMAEEWLRRMWPAEDGYQWIYSVHDDNGSRIMHAHTVLNAVNDIDGRKIHITSELSDELAAEAQKIAAEHGMSVMPDLRKRRREIARGIKSQTEQPIKVSAAEAAIVARGKRSWVAEIRHQVDKSVKEAEDWADFLDLMENAGFKVEWSRRGIGFRHPDSTGSDKKVLGTSLGLNYLEGTLRTRIGSGIDEALSQKVRSRRQLKETQVRGISTERAAVRSFTDSGVLRRPGRAQSATDVLLSRARMRRGDYVKSSHLFMDGLAAMRHAGVNSVSEVEALGAQLRTEINSVSKEFEALSSATETVEAMRVALRTREQAQIELSSMPKGIFSVESRKHRNELMERIVDADEKIANGLSAAKQTLHEQGIESAAETYQVERLRELCIRQRNMAERQLQELNGKLQDIRVAEKAMNSALGRRADVRTWTGRGASLMPKAGRSSTRTIAWNEALARAEASAKRSSLTAISENERIIRRLSHEEIRINRSVQEARTYMPIVVSRSAEQAKIAR